jgi:hypothetical protein
MEKLGMENITGISEYCIPGKACSFNVRSNQVPVRVLGCFQELHLKLLFPAGAYSCFKKLLAQEWGFPYQAPSLEYVHLRALEVILVHDDDKPFT